MKKIDISKSFKLSIDIILCFLIIFQSIKKGGFYTTDITFFIGSLMTLVLVYTLFTLIKYTIDLSKNKRKKFVITDIKFNNLKISAILFGILAIAYLLPIIFGTAADVTDSKYEFFRYLSIFAIYLIIKNSNYKKIYYYTVMAIGLLQAFIGIDGLASRILQPYFRLLNSGYLSKDLTRLSGTIQYANTTAILIAISGILIIDKINKYITKIKESSSKKDNLIISLYFTLFTVSTLAIILTSSRMVLILYSLTLLIYLLKSKSNKLVLLTITFISYIISFLGSNNILDLVLTNPSKVYGVFFTYILLSILAIRYIIKYLIINKDLNEKINKIKFNKTKFVIITSSILIIYIIIGLNVYKPLRIVNNTKDNTIIRQVYGLKDEEVNNINISIKENETDSRYSIVIYEENENFEQTLLTRFEYYDNISNTFNYKFTPKQDTKRINISLSCYSGSIDIEKFKLNENEKPLEYSLLPSDIVFRFIDSINGSTSIRDRLHYVKDSYKIWTTSPIFGTGGEGFKHLYKNIQTLKYTSTEAHNSILQIFVESGIIGGMAVCILIGIVLIKNKYSVIKLVFIMFILHGLTDLNFSFLTCLIVFTMLIAIMENEKNIKE